MKYIVFGVIFLYLDVLCFFSVDPEFRNSKFAFKMPGGGFIVLYQWRQK